MAGICHDLSLSLSSEEAFDRLSTDESSSEEEPLWESIVFGLTNSKV